MSLTNIYLLPIIHFIWFNVSFLVTYSVAVYYDHVYPIWPYISDTGVYPPESSILAQLFTFGSVLMAVVVYIRHLLLKEIANTYEFGSVIIRLDLASFWLGLIAVFGVSLLSNFQERMVWKLHFIGAALAYILGIFYTIAQTTLSVFLYPKIGSKVIVGIRIGITSVYVFTLVICCAFGIVSLRLFDGSNRTKWSPNDQGYTYHIISTANEWIVTISLLLFLLTYVYEFKSVTVYEPVFDISEGNVR